MPGGTFKCADLAAGRSVLRQFDVMCHMCHSIGRIEAGRLVMEERNSCNLTRDFNFQGAVAVFCCPQSYALTRRAWTHGRAVKPVCAVLSVYDVS